MPKLKEFEVSYTLDARGKCIIKAKTAKEAEKKFNDGDFEPDEYNEWNYTYYFENAEKIN